MKNRTIIYKYLFQWYLNNGVNTLIAPMKSSSLYNNNDKSLDKIEKNPSVLELSSDLNRLLQGCKDLENLKDLIVKHCDCALKKTAKNIVFSDGNSSADVMLIGEAPGVEEDKTGRPFVGEAGQLLDKMLNSIGQNRKNTYITNILLWRPPGNRKPTDEEILACIPFVKRHIELIRPKLLILAGATAAKSIYNTDIGITQIRGNWKNIDIGNIRNLKSIAIFHPAFLLRQPARKREAWDDLKKIKIEIDLHT